MIRIADMFLLAATKLRTHRVRTGITVSVAGLLFGLLVFVVLVTQGFFDSVQNFSSEGLNSKTVISIVHTNMDGYFNVYEHRNDVALVADVEKAHNELVARKKAAAQKYGVDYNAATDDPSPVIIDPQTKQKVIGEASLDNVSVRKVVDARQKAEIKPFDIQAYIAPYSSAHVLGRQDTLMPTDGRFVYMKDGKETVNAEDMNKSMYNYGAPGSELDNPQLSVLNETVTKPFIASTSFDPQKGEIPVIIPYSAAEKLLGYKSLAKDAKQADRLQRLSDVRRRISEVTVSFCYRNQASLQLLNLATMQREEMDRNKTNADYQAPSLQYTVTDVKSCGAVAVAKDVRTYTEKKMMDNRVLYEKEIGTYIGDPFQQKITVRGVGISSDFNNYDMAFSISGSITSMLSSWLGFGTWTVPEQLLAQVPAENRPDQVFKSVPDPSSNGGFYMPDSYLVEFGDKEQARQLLKKIGGLGGGPVGGNVYASPFGSGVLMIDELKNAFSTILFWALVVVGGIAVIILGGMIGRTVADGRRESAIFRAIGAKRSDIVAIYGAYTGLLSLRVVIFAGLLGGALAMIVELLWWRDATLGARLAYAASDTTKEFHLISVLSWYIPVIIGTILVVGMVASIIPIIRNARRNPIQDMRDDG